MKLFIIGISLTLSFSAHAGEGFRCINNMYREAALIYSDYLVSIQDSHVEGKYALAEVIRKEMGFTGRLDPMNVRLELVPNDTNCDFTMNYLFECKGRSDSATLNIEGFITDAGTSAYTELTKVVKVSSFHMKSHLTNRGGPIELGSDAVQVSLDEMRVEATAQVVVGEQVLNLKWTPFFYTPTTDEYSSCTKL